MILSDRDIRAAIESGQIDIEPFDPKDIQPSSIDLHVDRFFRTFSNSRHPYIDVKIAMDDLTEVIEVKEDEAFILHPGEFVLGSTAEYVKLPDDLVARLEGKSSLGRLGLLIHSSLPADEPVLFLHEGVVAPVPIGDIVRKELQGSVVSFDSETFQIGYHDVTGYFEGAADRIFEVVLGSGRRVQLTGGHDLFTIDRAGDLVKTRVRELVRGTRVAVAGAIPDLGATEAYLDLVALAPESQYGLFTCGGPTVEWAWEAMSVEITTSFTEKGIGHHLFYRNKKLLPFDIAREVGVAEQLAADDWLAIRGGRLRVPAVIEVDDDLAWLLGLYVAEGYHRRTQVVITNFDQRILDRAQAVFAELGLPVYRTKRGVTCGSVVFASLIEWLGMDGGALDKRIPQGILGWPTDLIRSFLDGFIDGDGSDEETRVCLWSSGEKLVGDLLLLCTRLGMRASASVRDRKPGRWAPIWQITIPRREHKLLTSAPLCDELLISIRNEAGLSQIAAAEAVGFRNTQLNRIERGGAAGVRIETLRRLRDTYASASVTSPKLDRLVDGALRWDTVVEVRDTGRVEPVYDLEVRPNGQKIENFLAGFGGIFASNTAGYVDPGFEGHLTLELSNVANLPITIYPNMKIGQISFFRLTSPAEHPYGSANVGSKYQGQRGPTPSRYYENFLED